MTWQKKFLLLNALINTVLAGLFPGSEKLEITRMDGSCRGHKVPIQTEYKVIKVEGNAIWQNITITIKEDILDTALTVTAQIDRCISKENLNSCQDFRQFKTNYCDMLDRSMITPFYIKYTPPFKCPFKKGVYKAYNTKMDLSTVMIFPLEKYYWKVKISVNQNVNNRLISCTVCEASSVAKPKH